MEENIIKNHQTKLPDRNTRRNNGNIEQWGKKDKMAILTPYISIIILDVNN